MPHISMNRFQRHWNDSQVGSQSLGSSKGWITPDTTTVGMTRTVVSVALLVSGGVVSWVLRATEDREGVWFRKIPELELVQLRPIDSGFGHGWRIDGRRPDLKL